MRTRLVLAALVAGATAAHAWAQEAEFFGVGHLFEQSSSFVFDLSADGTTATGWGDGPAVYTQRPFRWTRALGLQDLGLLITDRTTKAYAVSADGSVVVGSDGPFAGFGTHAFHWSPATGLRDLGVVHNGGVSPTSAAYCVSADGAVVCGVSSVTAQGGTDMFRWTAAGGMQRLGAAVNRGATDMSADGSVIVGFTSDGPAGPHLATRWTGAGGFEQLEMLPGGEYSSAESVSQDGRVIVGGCAVGGVEHAVRWTEAGIQDLGQLIPGVSASAYAVSGDGSVIGGRSGGCCNGQYDAFVWTEAHGFRNLNACLPALGVNLTGWRLTAVRGVSADGRTIAGVGEHNGANEGWVATLPESCWPDCNADGTLSLADFGCFQARFAQGNALADCNADGALNLADFGCFQARFALGCP